MHGRSYVVTGISSEVCRTERVAHYQTVDQIIEEQSQFGQKS